MPQRILIAAHNLSAMEGAPKVLSSLLLWLVRGRVKPADILVLSSAGGGLEVALRESAIEVKILSDFAAHGLSWKRYREAFSGALSLAEKWKPDLVFANVIDSFFGADLAFRLRVPCLWLIHESVDPLRYHLEWDPRLRLQFLHRLQHVDRAVFVAESTRRIFAKTLGPDSTSVIPNGVDLAMVEEIKSRLPREKARADLGVRPEETVISIIGTTTERKGQHVFLRGACLVKEMFPDRAFRFFVVGMRDYEYSRRLLDLSRELGISDDVTFVPETSEVARYFVASDALVIASSEESAPLVSLEAFAYGVPLVSTRAFGLAEQFVPEETALAFEVEDHEDLARQLGRLIEDQDLGRRLSGAAREDVAKRFSQERSLGLFWEEICQVHRLGVKDYG